MTYDINELSSLKKHWLMRSSNIPRRFIGMEPSDLSSETKPFPASIDGWIEKVLDGKTIKQVGGIGVTGVGLLFDGAPGLGKTTHAVVTAMEIIRRLPDEAAAVAELMKARTDDVGQAFRPVYYLTFPEFLSRKKAMIDADPDTKKQLYMEMEGLHGRAKEDWLNVRVLILDDLGKEYKGAGFNDASFDEILRSRYDKGLPTIITTNVSREKWAAQYGEAMGSFAYEAFKRVRIIGEDLRQL
jgi:DNA replication protein DnaC